MKGRGPAARQRAPPSAPRRRPRQPGKGRTDGRREAGAAACLLAPPPSPGSSATVPPSGSAARLEVTAPGGRPLRRPGAGWVAAAGWQLGRAAAARASRAAEGGRTRVVSSPLWSRLGSECAGGEAPASPPPPRPLPPSRSPRQGAAAGGGAAGSPALGGGRPPALGADRLLLDGGRGWGPRRGGGLCRPDPIGLGGREAPKTEGNRFEKQASVGRGRPGGDPCGAAAESEVGRGNRSCQTASK